MKYTLNGDGGTKFSHLLQKLDDIINGPHIVFREVFYIYTFIQVFSELKET